MISDMTQSLPMTGLLRFAELDGTSVQKLCQFNFSWLDVVLP